MSEYYFNKKLDRFKNGKMTTYEYKEALNDSKFLNIVKKNEACCLFYKKGSQYYVLPIFNYYTKENVNEKIGQIVKDRFNEKYSVGKNEVSILNYTHGTYNYTNAISDSLFMDDEDFIIYNNDMATLFPKFGLSTDNGMLKRSKVGQKLQECLLEQINLVNDNIRQDQPFKTKLTYEACSKGVMYMLLQMKNFIQDNRINLGKLLRYTPEINILISNLPFFRGHKAFVPSIKETAKIFTECCCENSDFRDRINQIGLNRVDDAKIKLHKMKGCKVFLDNLMSDEQNFNKIKHKMYIAKNIKEKLLKADYNKNDEKLNDFLKNAGSCDEYMTTITSENNYKLMENKISNNSLNSITNKSLNTTVSSLN